MFTPSHKPPVAFTSSEDVNNYLLRDPEVTVRVGSRRAPERHGRARLVDPDSDEDALARALVTGKYQPTYGGDLSGWRRESLPIAVDLERPPG